MAKSLNTSHRLNILECQLSVIAVSASWLPTTFGTFTELHSILSSLHKPSEEVFMQLLYTNCVPIIAYACDIKCYSARDMRDCNTALNHAIRKIFSFNRLESVKTLRESFGMKSSYEFYVKTKNLYQNENLMTQLLYI